MFDDAVWIVLVRRPLEAVRDEIAAFRATQTPGAHPWTVEATPAGCAIHSNEPGSEATFDFPLAELLSQGGAEAAVLWTEDGALFEYEDGRRRDAERATFDEWLEAHGHVPPASEPLGEVVSVLVFEGMSAAAVRAHVPSAAPVTVRDGPVGAILYHDSGAAGSLGDILSRGLDGEVYAVALAPELCVLIHKGGELVAHYASTMLRGEVPERDAVVGETTPDGILGALGLKT
ncbi:MAG: hypothetical protein RIT81_01070 [Deltaproteobacteria bacterium]